MSQHERERRADSTEVVGAEEKFKREGPEPAKGDTGNTVEEMNEAADSLVQNVEP
jgi:hypothetical protein